jgi:hypothetical protein
VHFAPSSISHRAVLYRDGRGWGGGGGGDGRGKASSDPFCVLIEHKKRGARSAPNPTDPSRVSQDK